MIRVFITALSLLIATTAVAERDIAAERDRMIQAVEAMARTVPSRDTEIDPAILAALREVPRHELVPENVRRDAYQNHPLFIGHGQTISSPTSWR